MLGQKKGTGPQLRNILAKRRYSSSSVEECFDQNKVQYPYRLSQHTRLMPCIPVQRDGNRGRGADAPARFLPDVSVCAATPCSTALFEWEGVEKDPCVILLYNGRIERRRNPKGSIHNGALLKTKMLPLCPQTQGPLETIPIILRGTIANRTYGYTQKTYKSPHCYY